MQLGYIQKKFLGIKLTSRDPQTRPPSNDLDIPQLYHFDPTYSPLGFELIHLKLLKRYVHSHAKPLNHFTSLE